MSVMLRPGSVAQIMAGYLRGTHRVLQVYGDLVRNGERLYVAGDTNISSRPSLNALSYIGGKAAYDRAVYADDRETKNLGTLHGIPIVVASNIDAKGFPTSLSTPSLRRNIATKNAPAVQLLYDQGAIVAAQSVVHEMLLGNTTTNVQWTEEILRTVADARLVATGRQPLRKRDLPTELEEANFPKTTEALEELMQKLIKIVGSNEAHAESIHDGPKLTPLRHPYDPRRIVAGPSAAAAVAVACGWPLALASDSALGSFRVSAAQCGLVGFRPTSGRYPDTGYVSLSEFDGIGPIAQTVEDVCVVDNILAREAHSRDLVPRRLDTLRIGVPQEYFGKELSSEINDRFSAICMQLVRQGVTLLRCDLEEDIIVCSECIRHVARYEAPKRIEDFLDRYQIKQKLGGFEGLAKQVADVLVHSRLMTMLEKPVPHAVHREITHDARNAITTLIAQKMDQLQVDFLLYPTTPASPAILPPNEPLHMRAMLFDRLVDKTFLYYRNTHPGMFCGMPAITIPAGMMEIPDTHRRHFEMSELQVVANTDQLPESLRMPSLPCGVEMLGRRNHDRELLACALTLEEVLRDMHPMQPPPMYADPRHIAQVDRDSSDDDDVEWADEVERTTDSVEKALERLRPAGVADPLHVPKSDPLLNFGADNSRLSQQLSVEGPRTLDPLDELDRVDAEAAAAEEVDTTGDVPVQYPDYPVLKNLEKQHFKEQDAAQKKGKDAPNLPRNLKTPRQKPLSDLSTNEATALGRQNPDDIFFDHTSGR